MTTKQKRKKASLGGWTELVQMKSIVFLLALLLLAVPIYAEADWWDGNWSARLEVNVSNPNNVPLTDYPVFFNLTYLSGMQSDFDDIRGIEYNSSNSTNIPRPFFMTVKNNNNWADFWINISDVPPLSNATFYIYFGKSDANSTENANNTFTIYSTFDNGIGLWSVTIDCGVSVSGCSIRYTNGGTFVSRIFPPIDSSFGWYMEYYTRCTSTSVANPCHLLAKANTTTTSGAGFGEPSVNSLGLYNATAPAFVDQGFSAVTNTFYKQTMYCNTTNLFNYTFNVVSSSLYQDNFCSAAFNNITTFQFGVGQSIYLDNVIVRKQADILPTTVNSSPEYNISMIGNFTIYFFDEETLSPLNNISILISNSTNVYNASMLNGSFTENIAFLPQNDVTVSAFYQSGNRNYYITLLLNESQSLNVFFPPTDNALYFTWYTLIGSNPLSDVRITIERYVNGTYRTVAEANTQEDGSATTLVRTNVQHIVVVTKDGYTPKTFTYTFSPALVGNPIYVQMSLLNSSGIVLPVNSWISNSLLQYFTPNYTYYNGTVTTVIADSDSLLSYVYLNVTLQNTTDVSDFYVVNLTGSQAYTIEVNLTQGGTYNFNLIFLRNSTLYSVSKIYITDNLTGIGGFNAHNIDNSGGLSVTSFQIIFFILVVVFFVLMFPLIGVQVVWFMPVMSVIAGLFGILDVLQAMLMFLLSAIVIKMVNS